MSSSVGISSAALPTVLHDIAHELRQPLSAIESIAYYLSLVLPRDDEKIQEQLARLPQLVEQSDWILSNGLHIAEPAALVPEYVHFEELIAEVVAARSHDIAPHLELTGDLPLVRVDPALGRSLIANLLTLFRQLSGEAHSAIIRTSSCGSGIELKFETSAQGYRSETALGPGGHLSLTSARRIVEAHGGTLDCSVDPKAGIRVRVMLP
jgi:signal transduction histidine kinase